MATQRQLKRRTRWSLFAGALVAALALGAVAYADDTTPDGDGAVPVALLDLNFGSVCNGVSTVDTVLIAIRRAEAVPDDGQNNLRVFNDGATLTVSASEPAPGSAAISESMLDNTIVLPADWEATALNTMSTDTATMEVTLVSSSVGAQSATVRVGATGLRKDGLANITRNRDLKVNWIGVECAAPEIKVEKTAAAQYFLAGGPVEYAYEVTNEGNVPLSDVAVIDDSCPSPAYVSGDDGNDLLDLTETWLYSCTYSPAFTGPSTILDNVATATGKYGDTTVDDKVGFKLMGAVIRKAVFLYWQAGGPDKFVDYDASGVPFDVDIYKRGVGLVGTEQVAEGPNQELKLWLTLKPSTASEPGWKFVEQAETGYPVADSRGEIGFNVVPDGGYLDNTLINTIDFNLSIVKSAPKFVGEDGEVTFTYAVKNVGPAAVTPVVTDDKCANVEYVSGDLPEGSGDGLIQPTEKWIFECTTTLTWYSSWNFQTGKQFCDTNTATVVDDEKPDASFWNPWEFYGGDPTISRSTQTLCPWIIRKDVIEFGTGNQLSDTTPFTVTIKHGDTVVGTVTIKEGDEAKFWLAPSAVRYDFCETVLPFYIPNFECWWQYVGTDYPDWTVVNEKWYGFSPGYYKNQGYRIGWGNLVPPAGYVPITQLEDVFNVPDEFGYDTKTLKEALSFQGGPDLSGKAQILLRAAVAALLNESRFGPSFGDFTLAELIANVNTALASTDGSDMTGLASELDYWNNGVVV